MGRMGIEVGSQRDGGSFWHYMVCRGPKADLHARGKGKTKYTSKMRWYGKRQM